jgi:hypothetical protein
MHNFLKKTIILVAKGELPPGDEKTSTGGFLWPIAPTPLA